jgi:hypothetical protein
MPRRGESLTRVLTLAKLESLQTLELRCEATVGSENDIVVAEVVETLLLRLAVVHKHRQPMSSSFDLLLDLLTPLVRDGC